MRCCVVGAYDGVTKFFERSLVDVAREYGYSGDNLCILEGDEDKLMREYPKTYQNLRSCWHQADRRTPIEYGRDLVASWLFEDYFVGALESDLFTVSLNGADRNRNILPSARTSAASDYLLKTDKGSVRLELMNDYTGYWAKQHKLHLRDAKYRQLQNSGSLFIAVSLPTRAFALYDFRKAVPASFIRSHPPYGGKPAYELSITPAMLQSLDDDSIVKKLEKAVLED